ncbi:hypothetical protein BGZ60DRAFT_533544 [Tricladium varicosporioides]|nr:hypothetical protein BGZ60DRAFT_533544 [Hymenoscyphus varicosporioides]
MPGIDDITPDNNDYVSRPRQSSEVPVVKDGAKVEDPIDGAIADGDVQLERDDNEAINKNNIIGSRTRNAKPDGGYTEPGDEEGLPGPDDGTSATAHDGTKP